MSSDPDWLRPDWDVRGVGAVMTTRRGGTSRPPFDSMNLQPGVDDPGAVAANQARLAAAIGATPVFLKQVHGDRVVRLGAADAAAGAAEPVADASCTTEPGIACTVRIADCLPVLFAAPDGRAVGAAHAGWRGLAAGVLERTVAALCEAGDCAPAQLSAWLGAAIGPARFQVGADVLEAFGASASAPDRRFVPQFPGKWLADLPGLARDRLARAGVQRVGGGTWCTVDDSARFFSFRRDGTTGRMAAAVWIERGPGRG
jgi:YfiH family protein